MVRQCVHNGIRNGIHCSVHCNVHEQATDWLKSKVKINEQIKVRPVPGQVTEK